MHVKGGVIRLVVRRSASAVHGACITMHASSPAVTLRASFDSGIAARSDMIVLLVVTRGQGGLGPVCRSFS